MTAPGAGSAATWLAGAGGMVSGNTPYAVRYGQQLKAVVRDFAARNPRSLQTYLGPSEIGAECDRQVVGKMAQGIVAERAQQAPELATTNHVSDVWPSIMGTAGHAWMQDAFGWDNSRQPAGGAYAGDRWLTEYRVTPDLRHPGTMDLYDAVELQVNDHKFLGSTALDKIKAHGPSRRYLVQSVLYALGLIREGYEVKGINILAWPRTGSHVDGLYVWHTDWPTGELVDLVYDVLQDTDRRHELAAELAAGKLTLRDIAMTPDDTECYFCPFYRPDNPTSGIGCPGTKGNR